MSKKEKRRDQPEEQEAEEQRPEEPEGGPCQTRAARPRQAQSRAPPIPC